MSENITIRKTQYLELLRALPFAKAVPLYLEVLGGTSGIGTLCDALGVAGRTWDNNLPLLVRSGLIVVSGREVSLTELSPRTLPRLRGNDSPEHCPDFGETIAPNIAPKSGNNVNSELEGTLETPNATISIVFSSLELNKQLKTKELKTNTPVEKNSKQNRTPAPRALSSWAALLEKPEFKTPNWLDLENWKLWLEDLQERKIKITSGALREQLGKLKKLLDAGYEQETVIKTAISRTWTTPGELEWFAGKKQPTPNTSTRAKTGTAQENYAALQAAFANQKPTIEVSPHD